MIPSFGANVWPRPPLLQRKRDQVCLSTPSHRPNPNFAPVGTPQLPIVRLDPRAAERSLDLVHWGRVPYWPNDINVGFANFNAKTEGIETRPAFRDAFQRRRYLVPVDNFCEWKKTATGKQPYAVALADRRLMALAGLWKNWRSSAGEWVRSVAIITTTPNELCAELHKPRPAAASILRLDGGHLR